MLFGSYYNGPFREDLALVAAAAPPGHDHDPGETVIQPRTISRANGVVRRWTDDRRMLFAAGLFLTVLADQVCFTHFPASYARFRALTMYPKWRGDCPGGCYHNIHPSVVFRTIGARLGSPSEIRDVPYAALPHDMLSTMKDEVHDFVSAHLPEVSWVEFWRRCEVEIPAELKVRS